MKMYKVKFSINNRIQETAIAANSEAKARELIKLQYGSNGQSVSFYSVSEIK